ncbi:hypothetical protein OROHE_009760 [Orobanche hederae]
MGKIIFFHLKYDGESKLISVDSTTSFDDFIAHASGKWNGITDLNIVLRYSIADVRNCSLDCEDDLRNLFSLCQILSAKLVYADISRSVEKQIAMIEHQNDTGDQYEHVHAPNEHEHIDYQHVHSDSGDSDFCVNRRSITNKTAILKTTRQNHLYDKFRVMPSYDVCPELKNKPLLSDNWCHILDDGVVQYFMKVDLDHSCIGNLVGNNNTHFGAKISGNLVLENIRADPNCNGKDIQKTLRVSYGLHFPYWKAWRAYESGMHKVFGSYDDSYDQLRWYCNAIERTNEALWIQELPTHVVHRWDIMIGRVKGTLLGATAKDGDNGLLPVAIAIVSAENTSNWVWFLEKLRDFVHHEKEICYLSDRNTGLMSAFPKVFSNPTHLFCLYHLLADLRGRFTKGWTNDQRKNLGVHFKNCAYAPNIRIFNEKLAIFKAVGGKVAEEWISELPLHKWAVAHSPNIKRYGEMTSNAAEQFNAWIKEWIVHRRQDSLKWTGALCPRKGNLWNYFVTLSRSWMVVDCPSGKFEVMSHPNAVVDLKAKECSCYQWQVRGVSCVHAVAVIRRKCPTVYSIVEEHFFTNTYRACYSFDIHSIPQIEKFEFQPAAQNSDKILPPIMNRQPGRPKGKRKPSFGEFPKKKPTEACARCGNISNHDPTTCLIPTAEAFWF